MANKYCPICEEENACMVGESYCWCYEEEFPREIFDLVRVESRRVHCICKECLAEFKEKQNK